MNKDNDKDKKKFLADYKDRMTNSSLFHTTVVEKGKPVEGEIDIRDVEAEDVSIEDFWKEHG